ncbi:MAG: hypothetical protein CSH37_03680 [Thalassolituus sp.]|nr:MAG: hypothetical protein CSH37_03680 [Thalassolituus sp.]
MNPQQDKRVSPSSYVPDGLAFCLGLALAWYTGWQTTDLIWSLWLSSLLIGCLTILLTIVGGLGLVSRLDRPSSEMPRKATLLGVGVFGSLFLLVFFSLHFCGFHAGHASFLSSFFPVPAVETVEFHELFMNPPGLLSVAVTELVPVYGLFVIPMLIAESKPFDYQSSNQDLKILQSWMSSLEHWKLIALMPRKPVNVLWGSYSRALIEMLCVCTY